MNRPNRPAVWVGHVTLRSSALMASHEFFCAIDLRHVFGNDEVSIFELRGGTHLILIGDSTSEDNEAGFDLMVEDIDTTWAAWRKKGLNPGEISRGEIHDAFEITEPGGNRITVNSTHVENHDAV